MIMTQVNVETSNFIEYLGCSASECSAIDITDDNRKRKKAEHTELELSASQRDWALLKELREDKTSIY